MEAQRTAPVAPAPAARSKKHAGGGTIPMQRNRGPVFERKGHWGCGRKLGVAGGVAAAPSGQAPPIRGYMES